MNTMNLAEKQEELRKKTEEFGMKVTFGEGGDAHFWVDEKEIITTSFFVSGSLVEMDMDTHGTYRNDYICDAIMITWEYVKWVTSHLVVHFYYFHRSFKHRFSYTLNKEQELIPTKELLTREHGRRYSIKKNRIDKKIPDSYVLREKKEDMLSLFSFHETVQHALKDFQEKNMTMTYQMSKLTLSELSCEAKIYYAGKQEYWSFQKLGNRYEIKIDHIEHETEDLQSFIPEYLQKKEKIMRLHNLYDPPMYHLKKLLNPAISSSNMIKAIHEKLQKRYSAAEIEEMAAKQENIAAYETKTVQSTQYEMKVLWYELFGLFFMLVKKSDKDSLQMKNILCIGTKEELYDDYIKNIVPQIQELSKEENR